MIALDTNILVHLFTRDDPEQFALAREVMESSPLWVPKTVLLEMEWVLRYSYGFDPEAILGAFQLLIGYPQLEVEDARNVLRALRWYSSGMDFADALHLASSPAEGKFASLDRRLMQAAERVSAHPPVQLLG